jgi:hypothetical protein
MSEIEGKFKSEAERALDEIEVAADKIRARLEKAEAEADATVKLHMLMIACVVCLLFGFIAGHIR